MDKDIELIFDRFELFKEEMGKRKIPQNNDLVFAAMIAHALYQLVDKLESIDQSVDFMSSH
jgi:hypothetical protein